MRKKIIGVTVGTTIDPNKVGVNVTDEQIENAVSNYLDEKPVEIDGYVPETRKIADVDLADDVSADEMKRALSVFTPYMWTGTAEQTSTTGAGDGQFSINFAKKELSYWQLDRWVKIGYIPTSSVSKQVNENSTDEQVPSAKLFYDTVGNIEAALDTIITTEQKLMGGVTE